ncbi:MAG: hypothetical protein OHK0046_20880 [Anaerolineae bacterium]
MAARQPNEIFITYSRRNKAFVSQVVEALKARGVDPWFDKDDIPQGAEWWKEIQRGILRANAYVFIITPESLRSEVSHWELDYAILNRKKIIPVVHVDVFKDAELLAEIDTMEWMTPEERRVIVKNNWQTLSKINVIFLQETDDLMQGVETILHTARTDFEYLEEHTRLLQRALEWVERQYDRSHLLNGLEVVHAEGWLTEGVTKEPRPHDLHVDYINASRENFRRRQRIYIGLVTVTAVFIFVLFIAAVLLFFNANEARAVARQNLLDALNIQTLFLADLSEEALRDHRPQTALLLALETLKYRDEGIYNVEGQVALTNALRSPVQESFFLQADDELLRAQLSPDESLLLTFTWDETQPLRVWDAGTGDAVRNLPHNDQILGALWSPVDNRVLTWDTQAYVWHMDETEPLVFTHDSTVVGAEWRADGARLLTWADDQTVRVWQSNDPTAPLTLPHEAAVRGAAWGPDGTHILTWTADNNVHVWDVNDPASPRSFKQDARILEARWDTTGERVLVRMNSNIAAVLFITQGDTQRRLIHDGTVRGAVWDADSSHILTFTNGSDAYLWTIDSDVPPVILHHPETTIASAIWSPDSRYVLTWAANNIAQVWDAATGDKLGSFTHTSTIISGVWSDDSRYILSWSVQRQPAYVWDPLTGEEAVAFFHDVIIQADWHSSNHHILTFSTDETVRMWDINVRQEPTGFPHDGAVNGAAWNADETQLLTWSDDTTARIWNAETSGPPVQLLKGSEPIAQGYWQGTQVITQAGNRLMLWDASTGQRQDTFTHIRDIIRVQWQGRYVLMWSEGYAEVWDTQTDKSVLLIPNVNAATWNAGASQVMAWGAGGQIEIWSLAQNEVIQTFQHDDQVLGAAWNKAETRVLSWGQDNTLRLWDATTGTMLWEAAHTGSVWGAAWNADETRILSWSQDNTARIWNATNGEQVTQMTHPDVVTSAAWSPDNLSVLTVANDLTARLWNADTGTMQRAIEEVSAATWSQDSQRVLLITTENTVRVWDIASADDALVLPLASAPFDVRWSADESYILTITGRVATIWTATVDELIRKAEAVRVRELTQEEQTNAFLLEIQ